MKEVCVESFYKEKLLLKKIIPQLFASKMLAFWAGDIAHW